MNNAGYSIAPWLTVHDTRKAIDFYSKAFRTNETYRLEGEGTDLVVRLSAGGAEFWVSNGDPSGSLHESNVRMILTVTDPDRVFNDSLSAGATVIFPVGEDHGWRLGRLQDPFGFQWEIGRPLFSNPDHDYMEQQQQYYENKLAYEMDPTDLFVALERGEDVVALDTRRTAAYEKEHIPTAINLPYREMNVESTGHLDKTKTYICYCDGIGCNASTRGALIMTGLGFKVKELTGGIEWWKFDGYETVGKDSFKGRPVRVRVR
jgi:rhodanese-related sulfurtransferase/uncharacterized glyoxalase superfamily protein PhnB